MADEKLVALEAQYSDWHIDVKDMSALSALCIGTMSPQRWAASATWYALGPNGSLEETEIVRKCKTRDAALDALAEALAKLGGVTVPRKVALALALVSAGRWSTTYLVGRLRDCVDGHAGDWGEQIFAALGTTEDEAFKEMKEE